MRLRGRRRNDRPGAAVGWAGALRPSPPESMFTTCIHCNSDLGRNEAFEAFPVGSRLAFDAAQGRLWVVCRHCARWNLSPLEERWEAIEAAERRFRDSRLRVSTENIGLARLREGVDIIRIGSPQRPEMAAWRYGDQFGRRRNRQMLVTGAVVGSAAALVGGMAWLGASVGSFAGVYANGSLWDMLIHGRPNAVVARILTADGQRLLVQRRQARMSVLERSERDGLMQLRLEHTGGTLVLTGDEAARAAQQIMPTVNRFGGARDDVQAAVAYMEEAGDPLATLSQLQRTFGARQDAKRWKRGSAWTSIAVPKVPGALHALPVRERLAFEMALHEESERRAMNGELEALTRAWREAEEIAKIADDMFVSAGVDAELARLKTVRDA